MNIDKKLTENLLKKGFNYVDSGYFEWEEWRAEMKSFISDFAIQILGLTDNDIEELLCEIWDTPFSNDGSTLLLREWAVEKQKNTRFLREIRNSMDQLFQAIERFRRSNFFLEMLSFCANFKKLAPYNAMMVKVQMPAARYVLTPKQWLNEYCRVPKLNARPLVILRKYGPVDYVFEIADTEPNPNQPSLFARSDEEILSSLSDPYLTTREVSQVDYNALIKALPYYGISLQTFRVGASLGAEILKMPCKVKIDDKIEAQGHYVISVNEKATKSTAFASIIHELGHFFCRHLVAPKRGNEDWWVWRKLTWEEQEFEAEIVSYIICERRGVGNKSWEYLSNVIGETGSIPENISVDRVFKAANEVERMLDPHLDPRTCLLYYNDKAFKKEYDAKFPRPHGIEIPDDNEIA